MSGFPSLAHSPLSLLLRPHRSGCHRTSTSGGSSFPRWIRPQSLCVCCSIRSRPQAGSGHSSRGTSRTSAARRDQSSSGCRLVKPTARQWHRRNGISSSCRGLYPLGTGTLPPHQGHGVILCRLRRMYYLPRFPLHLPPHRLDLFQHLVVGQEPFSRQEGIKQPLSAPWSGGGTSGRKIPAMITRLLSSRATCVVPFFMTGLLSHVALFPYRDNPRYCAIGQAGLSIWSNLAPQSVTAPSLPASRASSRSIRFSRCAGLASAAGGSTADSA